MANYGSGAKGPHTYTRCMRWAWRIGFVLALLVAVPAVAIVIGPRQDPPQSTFDGPVISAPPMKTYQAMGVKGRLGLDQGCLLLDDAVVYWPHGTSWDADRQAVHFGGDFTGSAGVGSYFVGGGGYLTGAGISLAELLGEDGATAVDECVVKTGREDPLLIFPTTVRQTFVIPRLRQ